MENLGQLVDTLVDYSEKLAMIQSEIGENKGDEQDESLMRFYVCVDKMTSSVKKANSVFKSYSKKIGKAELASIDEDEEKED